jgi:hypothetical protein
VLDSPDRHFLVFSSTASAANGANGGRGDWISVTLSAKRPAIVFFNPPEGGWRMGLIRERFRGSAPFKALIFGLVLIGVQAYLAAGAGAAQFMVAFSLKKLLIQVPAGIIAVWIASRFIDFDFGTIYRIALKIAAITVLAEGVACWIPIPFFSVVAELAVMVVGFFVLFELSKWQTYLIVLLNLLVLLGAHYLMARYISGSRSFGSRPMAQLSDRRAGEPGHRWVVRTVASASGRC